MRRTLNLLERLRIMVAGGNSQDSLSCGIGLDLGFTRLYS